MPFFRTMVFGALLVGALCVSADARVARFDLVSRHDVAFGYEWLVGKLHLAVRPDVPANRAIVDLDLAPRDANGDVEATADVQIVQPKDPARRNGSLLVEVNNRGGKGAVWHLNHGVASADPSDAAFWGDGYLNRQGFTLMWVGWQWDVPKSPRLMGLDAPVVHAPDGGTITGLVHSDWHVDAPVATHEVGDRGHTAYPVADENDRANVLSERDDVVAPRRTIARTAWHFTAGGTSVALDGGFVPGKIYELVYRAKDPVVTGLGFAAERDAVAWLKHDPTAPAHVVRAYGYGISQTGRFLRQMLYEGFNADENGRIVFDGVMPLVSGAALGGFNVRFGQPSRDAAAFSSFFYPVDRPPFDDVTLLAHGGPSAQAARIMYLYTSHEYYGRVASLMTTSTDGARDLDIPANVRHYAVMGTQHVPGNGTPRVVPEWRNPTSPIDYTWVERALFRDLDAWVRSNTAPPASRIPRIADGTLVAPGTQRFPRLPNIATPSPAVVHRAYHLDFGPAFPRAMIEPPKVGAPYPVLVPRCDSDGTDLGGIRVPDVSVPLAAYTGWNLRAAQTGFADHLVDFFGSTFPFSYGAVLTRYGSEAAYLTKYDTAIAALVGERLLLSDDETALHEYAQRRWRHLSPSAAQSTQ